MIKVDNPSTHHSAPRNKVKRAKEGTDNSAFSNALESAGRSQSGEPAGAAESLSPPIASTSIGGLLSLQEADSDQAADQQAAGQAHLLLDTLEDVRMAILSGGVPADALESIEQQMMALKDQAHDPQLRDIIEEIELRAAVELAKFRYTESRF